MDKQTTTRHLNRINYLAKSNPQKAMSELCNYNKDDITKSNDLTFIHNESQLKIYPKSAFIKELHDRAYNPNDSGLSALDVDKAKQLMIEAKPLKSWIRMESGHPRNLNAKDVTAMTDKARTELQLPSRKDLAKQIRKKMNFNINPRAVGTTARNLGHTVSSTLKRPFRYKSSHYKQTAKKNHKPLNHVILLKHKQEPHR